jgi:hypothetical protein
MEKTMDRDKIDALEAKIEMLKIHNEKTSKHYRFVFDKIVSDLKSNSLLEEAVDSLSKEINEYFKQSGYHEGF